MKKSENTSKHIKIKKSMESSKSSSKREVHSKKGLLQEIRKITNEQTNLQHKEKWKKNKQTQCQQNEGNNKDQRRNKIEVKNDRQDQ